MMNKNGHEAKQVLNILLEFVAIGMDCNRSYKRERLHKSVTLEVEPHTEIELARAARAARDAEEGRAERAAVLAKVDSVEQVGDVELEGHVEA